VKVVLSGDGGDELFAGYDKYVVEQRERRRDRIPAPLRAMASGVGRLMPHGMTGRQFLRHLGLTGARRYLDASAMLREDEMRRLFRLDAYDQMQRNVVLADPGQELSRYGDDWLAAVQYRDLHTYLPLDILTKVDRATMAHSLEARCPILDHRVIELAAAQSSARHGSASTTKRLFREVIAPWVPADVLSRPKRGFGVPLRRWFHEQMIGWAREILSDPRSRQRGWTRPAEVTALLQQHESGSRDHAKRIWALVCLELWARTHVDRVRSEARACA
jgi:asparagine synthase (glutamine-hydrolysing)